MRNQKIPQPGVLPKKPRLSVCMIVRNEGKMLPRCLKSVHGVADELIVVDTGSKDDTISIAKGFGAKVYHFEWCDDFAAARNESLKHATGDWIFQIDADEELLSGSIPHLKDAMLRCMVLYYLLRCDNGPRCRELRFFWVGRLFRRHPKVWYHRPYHEGVDCSVENLIIAEPRWQVQYEPSIIIRHYGYEPSEVPRKRESGLPIMKSYLKETPNDAYILTRLGGVCCGLGRYEEAEAYLNKALKINPDWSDTNYHLGITLQKQRKLDAAIRCYKKAISTDPYLAEAYVNLGALYIEKGMLDIAILELKKALDINSDLPLAHNQLGLAYKNKGMLDESIAEFKKAVAIDPDVGDAHLNLGVAYGEKGMLDESVAEHKLALVFMPEDASAHTNLGVTYAEKGMLDEAIVHYKRAIGIDPDLATSYINLGAAYYMKGMFDEAIAQYKRVLRIDPNNADAHFNLGVVYGNKGMINETITQYKRAVAINPDLAEAHLNLAVTYYAKKRYKLAIKHCDKAVALGFRVHPGFLQALKAYR